MTWLDSMANSLAAALWGGALVATLTQRPAVTGTTLLAPWAWSCLAMGLLGWSQTSRWMGDPSDSIRWIDHAAASAMVCPIVAVFGAKRPQARYWPFIVASLWLVLLLPAIESALVGRAAPDVVGLRVTFHAALIACGLLNYVATRNALPALLVSLAQIGVLLQLLRVVGARYQPALAFTTAACVFAAVLWIRFRPTRRHDNALTRIWLDFRDSYGGVWALRIAQRMNAMAQKRRWNASIGWSTVQGNHEFARCLTMLLRSFVSESWLLARADRETNANAPSPDARSSRPTLPEGG